MAKLASFFVLFFGLNASAGGFLFEPIIGYNKGQNQSTSVQGLGFGLRAGWSGSSYFFAADVDYSDLQQGTIPSAKYMNTGVTFGGNAQRFRFWYGMIMTASYSYPSGANQASYSGSGWKLGVGAPLSGSLNLNLELRTLNFTTATTGGTATPINEIGTIGFLSLSWAK